MSNGHAPRQQRDDKAYAENWDRIFGGEKGMNMKLNIKNEVAIAVKHLQDTCHGAEVAGGWWKDLKTGEDMCGKRNVPELLCLIHSEISESMEAHRKNLNDDKLPHRKGFEVELADALIRIFDLAGGYGLDLAGAFTEKLEYNASRADHKPENRKADGGKAY